MLFHAFRSQEERRAYGGGDFLQFAFCTLDRGTPIQNIVSNEAVSPLLWNNSSLYLSGDDWNEFYDDYGTILTSATYANLEKGPLDWCGINYFSPEQLGLIIEQLQTKQPKDYAPLLAWLKQGTGYNGFYVLGL